MRQGVLVSESLLNQEFSHALFPIFHPSVLPESLLSPHNLSPKAQIFNLPQGRKIDVLPRDNYALLPPPAPRLQPSHSFGGSPPPTGPNAVLAGSE